MLTKDLLDPMQDFWGVARHRRDLASWEADDDGRDRHHICRNMKFLLHIGCVENRNCEADAAGAKPLFARSEHDILGR